MHILYQPHAISQPIVNVQEDGHKYSINPPISHTLGSVEGCEILHICLTLGAGFFLFRITEGYICSCMWPSNLVNIFVYTICNTHDKTTQIVYLTSYMNNTDQGHIYSTQNISCTPQVYFPSLREARKWPLKTLQWRETSAWDEFLLYCSWYTYNVHCTAYSVIGTTVFVNIIHNFTNQTDSMLKSCFWSHQKSFLLCHTL